MRSAERETNSRGARRAHERAERILLHRKGQRFALGNLLLLLTCGSFLVLPAWGIALWIGFAIFPSAVLAIRVRNADRICKNWALWLKLGDDMANRRRRDFPALPPAREIDVRDHLRDVELAGPGSLHALLDITSTTEASRLLLDWLQDHGTPEETLRRQRIVEELLPLRHFRRRLRMLGGERGEEPRSPPPSGPQPASLAALTRLVIGLVILICVNAWTVILSVRWDSPALLEGGVALYLLANVAGMRLTSPVLRQSHDLERGMSRYGALGDFLRRSPHPERPALAALMRDFGGDQEIWRKWRRAKRILGWASLCKSPIAVGLLTLFIPVQAIFALLVELQRRSIVEWAPRMERLWRELEAFSALCGVADFSADVCFPRQAAIDAAVFFRARGLRHPLMEHPVANDVELGGDQSVIVLTGSNMSGKSTLMRAIALNTCLARAGAPVFAASLDLSPIQPFACLAARDSTVAARSYFYAEVRQLAALMDAARSNCRVLFLIDEILRGTNDEERRIGATEILRQLVGHGALGLVSTHDRRLAEGLTRIHGLRSFHMKDRYSDGHLLFDYVLTPGVATSTNALRIMEDARLVDPSREKHGKIAQ